MAQKITIYLKDDLPRGQRDIRIDQWIGKAICAPRNIAKKIDDEALKKSSCLYFLTNRSDEGDLLDIYVGETDTFSSRLQNHDYNKDWWQEIVVFFSQDGSLTKTGAKYLEHICTKRLGDAGKCNLKNGNMPSQTLIPEEDANGLELFFTNITTIMPLLGYDIFVNKDTKKFSKKGTHVYCESKDIKANGILLEDGKLLVLKDSTAIKNNAASFEKHNYRFLKEKLLKIGRLIERDNELIFTDDYEFNSPSAAAAVILARSASGPSEWRIEGGKKLKDII